LRHKNWQATVLQLMHSARLICLRIDETPSMWWELETALRSVPPERIVVFFDKDRHATSRETLYRQVAVKVFESLAVVLPETLGEAAFLSFRIDGSGELLVPKTSNREDDSWDVEPTLEPVYRRLSIVLPPRATRVARIAQGMAPLCLAFAADYLTKAAVQRWLTFGSPPLTPTTWLNLVLVYNPGAAFSFLSTAAPWQRGLFIMVALVALYAIARQYLRLPRNQMPYVVVERIGLGLLVGGALGNLTDRLWLGAVVTWVDLHWGGYHWPAFNLADVAVFVGGTSVAISVVMPRWRPIGKTVQKSRAS
jgi:signal peptidase II